MNKVPIEDLKNMNDEMNKPTNDLKGEMRMELTLKLQNAMSVTICDPTTIKINIPDSCARDLWKAQIEMWLTKNEDIMTLSSGYLRINKRNNLTFQKWR